MFDPRYLCLSLLVLAVSACKPDPVEYFPVTSDPVVVERGNLLVNGLAACGRCHGASPEPGSPLSGGQSLSDIYGEVFASNITPAKSGIGEWTTTDIANALRSSLGKDERTLSTKMHRGFEWMSDDDTVAVISYLLVQSPAENEVPTRDVGFVERNTTGFFDSRREVRGYVPAVRKKYTAEYGQYLVDHVARCGVCHNAEATFLTGEGYLDGGMTIATAAGEKEAPGIANSKVYGIGDWTEGQLVSFLKTGETPDGKRVDPEFCPVGFYKNAVDEDLQAIALYLRTVQG